MSLNAGSKRRYHLNIPANRLLHGLEHRLRHRLGMPPRWVQTRLLGKDLVVRDGTLTDTTDYDDAWFLACARHAKVVFDVGANVGKSALVALSCANVEDIVLVEPNADAMAVSAENLIRNGLSARARFVTAFAADASAKTVNLFTVGTGAAGSMYEGHAVTAAKAGSVQQVTTTTLDELADRFRLLPDFVKVDVEGAEALALDGSVRIAANRATRFLVEMHSLPELSMRQNATRVLEWAGRTGYGVWYLTRAARLESPDPIESRGRCHLLLQPADQDYPAWLRGIDQSAPLSRVPA